MTFDEAKQLTLWMRDQGVVQFSCDGLAVQFHPRVVDDRTPKRLTAGQDLPAPQPESQETEQANLLTAVFPPP